MCKERNFHHCGGPVNLVQGCLSVGNVRQSLFIHRRGPVNLEQGCLSSVRFDKAVLTTVKV